MCNMKPKGSNRIEDDEEEGEETDATDVTESTSSDSSSFKESSSSDSETDSDSSTEGKRRRKRRISDLEWNMDDDDSFEDEDPLVVAIRMARLHNVRLSPPPIKCDELCVDLSFHPKENILVSASVSGDVYMYSYDDESTTLLKTMEMHTKACRAIKFTESGDSIITVSKDRSIMITDGPTSKLKGFYDDAHESPLYSLTVISENVFVTGDEDGVIKIWDLRQKTSTFALKDVVQDYVSSMTTNSSKRYLACTSGEGILTTINLIAKKLHVQSEQYGAEYTCAGLYRDDSKLAVGTSNGKLVLYNWGEFGLHNDVYPMPEKNALNCQVAVSDNISITGWDDGQIKAIYVCPHRALGIVGQHNLSVDALDVSHNGEFVASCSLDQTIHFWRISFLNDMDFSELLKDGTSNLPSSQYDDRKTFFNDLKID